MHDLTIVENYQTLEICAHCTCGWVSSPNPRRMSAIEAWQAHRDSEVVYPPPSVSGPIPLHPPTDTPWQRDILTDVLIHHTLREGPAPHSISCRCGWGTRPQDLGRSYADHICDLYENLANRKDHP